MPMCPIAKDPACITCSAAVTAADVSTANSAQRTTPKAPHTTISVTGEIRAGMRWAKENSTISATTPIAQKAPMVASS